jgi:hypothetical protein
VSHDHDLLDEETIIETVIEIATGGRHAVDAAGFLRDELANYGHAVTDIEAILDFCHKTLELGDIRSLAKAMFVLLQDVKTTHEFLETETFSAACLMVRQ